MAGAMYRTKGNTTAWKRLTPRITISAGAARVNPSAEARRNMPMPTTKRNMSGRCSRRLTIRFRGPRVWNQAKGAPAIARPIAPSGLFRNSSSTRSRATLSCRTYSRAEAQAFVLSPP